MSQSIKAVSDQVLQLCHTPNTALQAIHLIIGAGGASERSWQAVCGRVFADDDVLAAFYLVRFAQKADDLPFEILPLLRLIFGLGDASLQDRTLAILPHEAKDHLTQLGLLERWQH